MGLFCIPLDFNKHTVDSYAEINYMFNNKIYETYGQIAPKSLFPSCTNNSQLPEVNKRDFEEYIVYSKEKGIEFNYILDPTCMSNNDLTGWGYRRLKMFFRELVQMGVDSVTLSLPSIIEICKYVAPELKIVVSEVNQTDSLAKADFYEKMQVSRITLDDNINRNFNLIKSICNKCSVDTQVIANSMCIMDCPYRTFHYNYLSHTYSGNNHVYPYYIERCRQQHADAESLIKMNYIRPEDVKWYQDAGVTYFKLCGAINVSTGKPVEAAEAYISGEFEGNLIELLEMFSTRKPLSILGARIDNGGLDGFINKFVEEEGFCTKKCIECNYCKKYSKKAIKPQDEVLLDFMAIASEAMRGRFFEELEK